MGLQQFERRLERLVEGTFAKAFRSGLQPVEVGRRLSREMDLQRTVGVHGLIAPNQFKVAVSPDDAERFSSFSEALVRELSALGTGDVREASEKIKAASRAPSREERAAALEGVLANDEGEPLNRALLVKFLSSVRS